MPIRSLLLGLIAVSAIVILGMFLQSLFAAKPEQQAAAPPPPPKQVLVASADLPHGRLLRPEDVRWQNADKLPPEQVANALMTQVGGPTAVDAKSLGDNVGAITRHDFTAGEVLETSDVVKPGDRDFIPAVLTPGYRAITVSVSVLSGSAGLIYPGDHVDLILAQSFHDAVIPLGRRNVSENIAQNLRVLAIDHYTQGGTISNNNEPQLRNSARTVTLEASPEVSLKIQNAADLGKLSLILRSLDAATDSAPKEEDTTVWAEDTSKAIGQIAKIAPEPDANKPSATPAATHKVVVYRGDAIDRGTPAASAASQ
jgi:pilus assembly protein CpaB